MLDRNIIPNIKDAIDFDFKLSEINHEVFANNIPIYHLKAGSQDVVQIDWVFEGGLWCEKKPSVAHAFGALLKNGTMQHNEFQINESIEFYGADVKVLISNDYTSVSLSTLTKHLPMLLPVIHEILTQAIFPESELKIYKNNAIQALTVRLMNCDFVANRLIEQMVWGKAHPYGRYSEIIDIESLSRDDVMDYYHDVIKYNNCKIFVAGQYNNNDIQLIHNYFGNDNWGNKPLENAVLHHPILASSVMKMHELNDATGKQAAVRLCREFVHRTHEDFVPFQLLNTVLGGYFGSRLMSNIREEKGYTYGIYSFIGAYRHNTMMMISSEVERSQMYATIQEIHLEMKRLQNELITDEELLLVKNYLLGGLLGDLDGPFSIMRFWKTIILNNLTIDEFYRNINIYKNTDNIQLQRLAQIYLNPDDYYHVTVI